ncbi:interleukin-31 receptor subunit alpha-like [Pungitius pungitius]|uniref:interleukin-31 receptor subunit alpha-like n=1 Tax=Pungitius pungitius TaxID=134920 RepID=UPI002E12E226
MKNMSLFLALLVLAANPSICKGQHENTCNVVLKDQYIEWGSDTDIVYLSSCVPPKIFWTLNNRRVEESQWRSVNSTHAVLSLRNFTHQSAILEWHSADTHQVLGGTTITAYSKPGKISCILYHKNQSDELSVNLFKCSWEDPNKPSAQILYTVLLSTSSNTSPREVCRSNSKYCIWTKSSRISPLDTVTITVRAKAAAWEAGSDPRAFFPDHIRKMIRPKLTVTPFPDHVSVQWLRASFSKECHCEVSYRKAVDGGRLIELRPNTVPERSHGKVHIEEWDSCSNYTFSVRCALHEAPWSDWSEKKTVLTKLKKKDVKPLLWRKVSEPTEGGVRKVHAMWKEFPSTCRDTFTSIKKAPNKEGADHEEASCATSTCDVYVNRDAHRIILTLLQNKTLLVEDSVYVPAIGESLPRVTDIRTSTREGVILVSWKASTEPATGYMIDWTHGGNQYYWEESGCTNATLSGLLDKQPYNITVTPLFADRTGHGARALQICSGEGDPGNVAIQVQAKAKSALVSWTVRRRGACGGAVVNYTVRYGAQRGPRLSVTVDGKERLISLKDLRPETQYSVHVEAAALTGTTKSRETLFYTKRFDPEHVTAVSVSVSVAALLVLALGSCVAVLWKKFKRKPVPNPALSSVVFWPAASHQEGTCPLQPFSNPSEIPCDRVDAGEALSPPSTSSPAARCDSDAGGERTEEYVDPPALPAPGDPVKSTETRRPSPPDDSTGPLLPENSPYRRQNSVERSSKQCKRVLVKPTVTVYVTLDMFEQGQDC